ncbi:DUF4232 domain-containing protein [Streptantibioticus parmotrematis]|uniref:DUF4232 domain-containing protein n=1 Tax=Streptantibioticus parmotrematis TaxID=2873249 RepID=UPI0034032898
MPKSASARLITLATVTAAAALSLTACAGGGGVKASGPGVSVAPSASTQSTGPTTTGTGTTGTGGTTASDTADRTTTVKSAQGSAPSRSHTGTGTTSASGLATCGTSSIRVTVQRVTRPINHVVLQATNTSSRACELYGYPDLKFSEHQQAVTAVMDGSQPQAVVTLAPGASGYASVMTEGEDTYPTERVSVIGVYLQDRSGAAGGRLDAKVPGAPLYVEEEGAAVSYWQPTLSDALTW